jgi:hypothetical protein
MNITWGVYNIGVMTQISINPLANNAICPRIGEIRDKNETSINVGKMIITMKITQIMVKYKSCNVCHPIEPGETLALSDDVIRLIEL